MVRLLFEAFLREFSRICGTHIVLMQMQFAPLTPPFAHAVMQMRFMPAILALSCNFLQVILDSKLAIVFIMPILPTRWERAFQIAHSSHWVLLISLVVMPMKWVGWHGRWNVLLSWCLLALCLFYLFSKFSIFSSKLRVLAFELSNSLRSQTPWRSDCKFRHGHGEIKASR